MWCAHCMHISEVFLVCKFSRQFFDWERAHFTSNGLNWPFAFPIQHQDDWNSSFAIINSNSNERQKRKCIQFMCNMHLFHLKTSSKHTQYLNSIKSCRVHKIVVVFWIWESSGLQHRYRMHFQYLVKILLFQMRAIGSNLNTSMKYYSIFRWFNICPFS